MIRILWFHFHITALLDGYSKKLLALAVFDKVPTANHVLSVLKSAIGTFGAPRFLVTDQGPQFRERFQAACKSMSISHIRGRPYDPKFNGKIERFFRTLKLWQRVALLFFDVALIQSAFNNFLAWYNTMRTHQALGGLTPDEAWAGTKRPAPFRYLARDKSQPKFQLRREHFGNDSKLPVFNIYTIRPVDQKSA